MATMATIKLDLDRRLGTVDRRILSGFAEHLGRCIYGGIYDEGSPLADANGFRTDVIEAVKALKPPILRWPGGNFVSGYHWTDGIGPKDKRPRRLELAWHSEESNRFGTDEFLQFCDLVGAEPYLCANMGSAQWTRPRPGSSTATEPATRPGRSSGARTGTRSRTRSATGGSATRCTARGRSGRCRPRTTSSALASSPRS